MTTQEKHYVLPKGHELTLVFKIIGCNIFRQELKIRYVSICNGKVMLQILANSEHVENRQVKFGEEIYFGELLDWEESRVAFMVIYNYGTQRDPDGFLKENICISQMEDSKFFIHELLIYKTR